MSPRSATASATSTQLRRSAASRTDPVRKAGVYVRISYDAREVDENDPDGAKVLTRLGVKRQRKDCTTEAKRRGWRVVEVYEDNDASAFSGKARVAYERMLDDIAAGRIDAVICWHPD